MTSLSNRCIIKASVRTHTNPIFASKMAPGRDARIPRYSRNMKYYVRISGELHSFSTRKHIDGIRKEGSERLTILASHTAGCSPAQKVPKEWCFKQFWNMCRNGRKNGSNVNKYGTVGCQTWYISQKGWAKPSGPR